MLTTYETFNIFYKYDVIIPEGVHVGEGWLVGFQALLLHRHKGLPEQQEDHSEMNR